MATTLTVKTLKNYIDAGLNVIISGVHGVGKTAKLQEACDQLKLSMKYYSASTLDPYTDLTGIPVPNQESRTVEYFRPREIDRAEVIFFDELNRADPKTLNTLMEIIQFHSINGEKLPNLKCVIAAINPVSEEYATDELDAALMDRFDVFLNAEPAIDHGFFVKKFGDRLGAAAAEFWNNYEKARLATSSSNEIAYISPRRMEKITAAFKVIPARQTIIDTLPPEVSDSSLVGRLHRALSEAIKPPVKPTSDLAAAVTGVIMLPISGQKKAATGKIVEGILQDPALEAADKDRLLNSLAAALNDEESDDHILQHFSVAVKAMKNPQRSILTNGWSTARIENFRDDLGV